MSASVASGGKAWIDGAVVDAEAARVPIFDRGFLYGDSVYEVLRTYGGGHPFGLEDHLDRLAESARRLGLALPARSDVAGAIGETIRALPGDSYVRVVVTRGAGPIGLDPALGDTPRLVVLALPLVLPDEKLYRDGAQVALVGARRNSPGALDPLVKSGNYLNSVLAVAEARTKGAYEALMCDAVGRLAEGSSSNLFLVSGGRITTPPLSVGLLEGITRRHVMKVARELGIAVDEANLWPIDLRNADEAFLTSSVRGVMPIAGVDGEPIGDGRPGPISQRVRAAYEAHALAAATAVEGA